MKKVFVSFAAILLAFSAWAIPAKPGVFSYRQPDGSLVRLERHGDEFFNWTTLAGTSQAVMLDETGFWKNTTIDPAARDAAILRRRQINAERAAMNIRPRTHTGNPRTHGEKHILVFLVEFQDVKFSIQRPYNQFEAMLNQNGYSDHGATGSVQDYFIDNSRGYFTPVFDVYGPITLPKRMSYYGSNSGGSDSHPELALYHAALQMDDKVDFSQYDYDQDGFVDMALFFYAGYSEAEGGSNDSIWPHSWNLQYSSSSEAREARFDGVGLNNYFCTSELKGYSGTEMCGIGATCHELSHSLGVPDFYDTDGSSNGYCAGLYYFSLMDAGSYLNDSRTPPYYNSEERRCVGWMVDANVHQLPNSTISFGSIKDDIAYRTVTETEDEYFLYECRDGSGWDAYLPKGLLIYHVDKSTARYFGGMTPHDRWVNWHYYNSINAQGNHPCFYVVPAAAPSNLNYGGSLGNWVFPGSQGVTSYTPIDWNKHQTPVTISNIHFADGMVNLKATYSNGGPDPDPDDPEDPDPDPGITTFAQLGLTAIANPGKDHYEAGDVFMLKMDMPEDVSATVTWHFDSLVVTDPVTLQSGQHTVLAILQYDDGSVETFELIIDVK